MELTNYHWQVNGMDIIAAKRAVEFARKWAVDDQNGPLLLEFVTYRYGGHSCVHVILSSNPY